MLPLASPALILFTNLMLVPNHVSFLIILLLKVHIYVIIHPLQEHMFLGMLNLLSLCSLFTLSPVHLPVPNMILYPLGFHHPFLFKTHHHLCRQTSPHPTCNFSSSPSAWYPQPQLNHYHQPQTHSLNHHL